MKCIDQMLRPNATPAAAIHASRHAPPWARTRRNRSSAVQEPNHAVQDGQDDENGVMGRVHVF